MKSSFCLSLANGCAQVLMGKGITWEARLRLTLLNRRNPLRGVTPRCTCFMKIRRAGMSPPPRMRRWMVLLYRIRIIFRRSDLPMLSNLQKYTPLAKLAPLNLTMYDWPVCATPSYKVFTT